MKRIILPLLAALALPSSALARYYSEVDLMTDETIHRVVFKSSTTTPNSIGMQEEAIIRIKCKIKEGRITERIAYISTPTYNSDNIRVGLRWDGGTPRNERWAESTSGTALFAPNASSFVSDLAFSDSLVFQWSPYSTTARAVKFELDKLHNDLEKLSEVGCFVFE